MLHTLAATTLAFVLALGASQVVAAGQRLVHSELTLRGGPGPKFNVVGTVVPGTGIAVMWCNSAADWCLVDGGNHQGWASLDDIRGQAGSNQATAIGGSQAPAAPVPKAASGGASPAGGASVTVQAPRDAATVKSP
jgi:uncharacterized protein YraI